MSDHIEETRRATVHQTQVAEGPEYARLPSVHITPNRLVALNMAYWRKVAGYTQEELAQKLNRFYEKDKPWTNASVSAAERSWDGKRVRQFDADVIFSLATIFGLPMTAFFLPPEDDGVKQRYLMDLPQAYATSDCMAMRDVMDLVTNIGGTDWTNEDEEHHGEEEMAKLRTLQKTNERYRQRLDAVLAFYRREALEGEEEPTYAQDVWGARPEEEVEREELEAKLARAQQHYEALRQIMGDINAVQEDLHQRLHLTSSKDRLSEKLAETVVQRFRAGDDVKAIAKSIKQTEWLVEKALIDAREGYLSYSPEEKAYVFQSGREIVELYQQELAAARDSLKHVTGSENDA